MTRRMVERHVWQDDLDDVTAFTKSDNGSRIYAWRKQTIERSFAEAKVNHGLRYARMLGIQNMREQCFLTAAVQNIKRLVASSFLSLFFFIPCFRLKMLRLSTLQSLATEKKVIVVASVAAIYPSVDPKIFNKFRIILNTNSIYNMKQLQYDLVRLAYKRNDVQLLPGYFKVHGDVLEIIEGYNKNEKIRISFFGNKIEQIAKLDALTSKVKHI